MKTDGNKDMKIRGDSFFFVLLPDRFIVVLLFFFFDDKPRLKTTLPRESVIFVEV